ncbi:hypothetical protein EMIT0194P_240017 [Pseudomonas serbica]
MIIAPQSLSWQPFIDDLQGGFTARQNPPRALCTLIYLDTGITRQLRVKGRAQGTSGSRIFSLITSEVQGAGKPWPGSFWRSIRNCIDC